MGQSGASWFGSADLAVKYGIVLGSICAVVILAGFIKLAFDKRKLRKHTALHAQQAKAAPAPVVLEEEKIAPEELEEGDLFGVRAIQSGFYGGVAQSQPSSPASSRSPSLCGRPVSPTGSMTGGAGAGVRSTSISPTPLVAQPLRAGGPSPSPAPTGNAPRFPKPKPLVLRPSASSSSLGMRSPLSQNPVTADEISGMPPHHQPRSSSVYANGDRLPLPTPAPARVRPEPQSRPSFASDRWNPNSRSEPGSPVTSSAPPSRGNDSAYGGAAATRMPNGAPQIDLPSRGFSPAFQATFGGGEVDSARGSSEAPRPRTVEKDAAGPREASRERGRPADRRRVHSFSRPLSVKSYMSTKTSEEPMPARPSTANRGDDTDPSLPPATATSDADAKPPSQPAVADWGPTVFSAIERSLDESRTMTNPPPPPLSASSAPPHFPPEPLSQSNSTASGASTASSADRDPNPFADSDARSSTSSASSVASAQTLRIQRLSRPGPAVRVPSSSTPSSATRGTFFHPSTPTRTGFGNTDPPASPDIELATLDGSTFPKPPRSARQPSVKKGKGAGAGARPGAPVLTASSTPFNPSLSGDMRGSPPRNGPPPQSQQQHLPPTSRPPTGALPAPPRGASLGAQAYNANTSAAIPAPSQKLALPLETTKASTSTGTKDPRHRLTDDILGSFYESYSTTLGSSATSHKNTDYQPYSSASGYSSTSPNVKQPPFSGPTESDIPERPAKPLPPMPPASRQPPPPPRHSVGPLESASGLMKGQQAEFVDGNGGERELENVLGRGMNERLRGHVKGGGGGAWERRIAA